MTVPDFKNIQAIETMAWICAMQEYMITELKVLPFLLPKTMQ